MTAFAPLPLAYFAGTVLTGLVALQSRQQYRPLLSVIYLLFAWQTFSNLLSIFPNVDHASLFGLFILVSGSHLIHALLVEKAVIPLPHSPTPTTAHFPSPSKINDSTWNWHGAYKLLYSYRWVGTRNIAPDVPAPRRSPSKIRFSSSRLMTAAALYTFHNLYTHFLTTQNPPLGLWTPFQGTDFSPEKDYALRRLSTITEREAIIRFIFIFQFIWTAWYELEVCHQLFAFFFVAVGLDEPEDWRPLFGSITEAYTLRRYWGSFWHRLVYRCYGSYGRIFSNQILGLRKGSAVDRMVCNGMVFFLSGCVHGLCTWRLGLTCGYWEDVWWFMVNFAGIYMEEVFFRSVEAWTGKDVWLTMRSGRRWKRWGVRAVGYAWVLGFMWWSLPRNMFPKLRCLPREVVEAM